MNLFKNPIKIKIGFELQEHEKTCLSDSAAFESDDDDVIFCGEEAKPDDKTQQQNSFLQHFQLCQNIPSTEQKPMKTPTPHKRCSQSASHSFSSSNNNNTILANKNNCANRLDVDETEKKVKRVARRTPGVMGLLKSQIPITSPAGQRLISQSNTPLNDDYARERIERYERFCAAPPLAPDGSNRPKFMDKKPISFNISTFRNNTKHFHCYKFPRRQFSTKARNEAVALLERIQLQQSNCKPCRIKVQRLSNKEIEDIKTQVKVKRRKLNPKPQSVIDFIDLCSSDAETDDGSSEMSHETSGASSSSTKVGRRTNTVLPTHNTLLFVDCSVPAESKYLHSSIESMHDPRLQLSTSRSQYDSASNLLDRNHPKQHKKLYAATHRPVDLQHIQQDKENRLFTYISEQSNNPQTAAYIYSQDDLSLNIDSPLVTSSNLISIDLTL